MIDKEKEIKKSTTINNSNDKNQKNLDYSESNLDLEWDDDFITNELNLSYNENDQLLNESKK